MRNRFIRLTCLLCVCLLFIYFTKVIAAQMRVHPTNQSQLGDSSSEIPEAIQESVPRLVLEYGSPDVTGWRRVSLVQEGVSFLVPVAAEVKREKLERGKLTFDQTTMVSFSSSGIFFLGRTVSTGDEWEPELKALLENESFANDTLINMENEFRVLMSTQNIDMIGLGRPVYDGSPTRDYVLNSRGKLGRGRVFINQKGLFIIYALASDEPLTARSINRFMNSITFQ